MDFPTAEEFDYEKIHNDRTILKWREVPTGVIYHIEDVMKISTRVGISTIVRLCDEEGRRFKAFVTNCLKNDLYDFDNLDGELFIRSLGKKQRNNNPGQFFYHYELMKKN